jgi:hypothetical protein
MSIIYFDNGSYLNIDEVLVLFCLIRICTVSILFSFLSDRKNLDFYFQIN